MVRTGKRKVRDWYSISLSSAVLLGLVALLIVGGLVLQHLQQRSLRARAETAVAEATGLARAAERREDYEQIRLEHFAAWENLEVARTELAAERYQSALDRAERSLEELRALLRIERGPGEEGSRFTTVQGGVEYRRSERGAWKRARQQDVLNPGDWVKTSADGTAEIRLSDGSTYVVRRNSMVRLGASRDLLTGRPEQVTRMEFGRIELNTRTPSKVTTPNSEAEVRQDSEAQISFDRDQGAGRFASFKGSVEVVSASGQTREVRALQQVEQVGDLLSPPKPIPGRPQLLRPANDQQVDLDGRETQLAWSPVEDARRYELQVSRSPLFASNVVSDSNRRKTSARLGLRGEGIFYWQVAAVDKDGARGPWSETRTFRVASLRSAPGAADTDPPELEIQDMQTFGSLVIVNGRTEPGATVKINDEPVSVQADGSFSKTIQMPQVGFAFVRIVATDAWDNPTEVKRRVYIDAF